MKCYDRFNITPCIHVAKLTSLSENSATAAPRREIDRRPQQKICEPQNEMHIHFRRRGTTNANCKTR